ncbi:MAG: leucine-rich repeat protein, partial [Clostridia bacterium]|nr:leucine-rich repeat protein [Clostridia bacterium]
DYCYELRSADIPKATFIDEYAFYYCYSLETINMANVIEIGPSAFYNCSKLESVTMPSVLAIGNEAFYDCHSLYLVDMPKVTTIGESAFYNCESLQDVIMPSIGTVYSYAFDHCHPDLTIHGYYGSFAELYAGENGYNFSPLNAHTVNFYVEGVITGTQSVMENDFAVEIVSPSKEGQYFLGWYTEGGEYYWFDTPVTEDISLYAKFGYYVAIYLDENDTEPVGWMSVEAGQCAEEPGAPGKEGKVFVGWYTEGGTKYDFSTPVTSDINIYAKFVDESAEWVKSVSHSISDGKIYFTVITAPGPYNRVKLTAADDKGGYIAYTNSYTVNSDGDYVWTIKTTAPASTTDYAFDARSSETGKYLKEYYDYTAEIATGIKSVSHEITGGKLVFTVITGAADFNRVKVSLASDLGSYLAYTNTYTVNADGDYVWTIKITPPSSPEDYSFDIRSASTGKYLKDYYNYSVSVIPTIKSVSHEIVDTKIVFTVVTKPGNFNRIKVTLADNLGGSLGVANDYTVNADGDYVWTVKATAPTVATDYAFDLRSSETSKYTKDYGYYSVTEIPVVKAISYTISNGKIFFTVITEPGNFARMKVTTADNLGGSLGVATTYTVNADGNYVWMLKAPEPTTDTTYAVDLRDAATGKYMKDYYYCEAQAKEPTILSATHEIVGDKVIFTVVTKAGSYDRIKVALATSLGTSLAVATTYTVDSDGNYVWTIKTTAPTAETTYAFDLRASGGKYLKDYSYYDVEE